MSLKSKWIRVDKSLPEVGVYVSIKRDLSSGIGGYTGYQEIQWLSIGRLTRSGIWSIMSTVGLNLNNSKPTHWRYNG